MSGAQIITDLSVRRAMHRAAKRTPKDAVLIDLRESVKLLARQTEVNEFKLAQAKRRVMHAIEELAKLSSAAVALQFVERSIEEIKGR